MCLNVLYSDILTHQVMMLCCQVNPVLCRPWNKALLPSLSN